MSTGHRIHIAAGDRVVVSIEDFQIPENRITLLLGESGIGKSLMSKALYGLLDPDELTISIDGHPYKDYLGRPETRQLQLESFFVFQEPSTHLNPLLTLGTQLREGSLQSSPHEEEILQRLWENSPPGDVQNILEVYPKPYRPSGGEKQRILLAMAFKKIDMMLAKGGSMDHEIFIFDEPTGSLDNRYRNLFLAMLFERFRKTNFTCLLITHDYSMIGKIHESHRDLMDRVAFKEVTLHGDALRLDDFDPETYLKWLSLQQPSVPTGGASPAVKLLSVESGARVFDRRLMISQASPTPLVLNSGEMIYLKASSGVGKTTLVKLVMGLLKAQRLMAQLDGMVLTETTPARFWQRKIWGRKMTMVFQHADEALNPESTVKGVFAGLPTLRNRSNAEIFETLQELFEVDITFLNKKVKHLSGGQKQRLNLLRGFALDTDILILDEPLNGLDFESAGKVIAMLQRKQSAGKGILLISHNEEIFDRIVSPKNVYNLSAELMD